MSDRFGVRIPSFAVRSPWLRGLAVAFTVSDIRWLFVCPALIGLGHIFFHVSIHNLVGSPAPAERTRNPPLSPWAARRRVHRPVARRLCHRSAGRPAFAILAVVAATPALVVLAQRSLIPTHVRHEEEAQAKSAFDLLAIPALRRTLIMSGVHLTGIEPSSSTCRSTAAPSASRLR